MPHGTAWQSRHFFLMRISVEAALQGHFSETNTSDISTFNVMIRKLTIQTRDYEGNGNITGEWLKPITQTQPFWRLSWLRIDWASTLNWFCRFKLDSVGANSDSTESILSQRAVKEAPILQVYKGVNIGYSVEFLIGIFHTATALMNRAVTMILVKRNGKRQWEFECNIFTWKKYDPDEKWHSNFLHGRCDGM